MQIEPNTAHCFKKLQFCHNLSGNSNKLAMDYVELRWTLLDYVGLCWTTLDYVGLRWTTSDYGGLHYTMLDYVKLS